MVDTMARRFRGVSNGGRRGDSVWRAHRSVRGILALAAVLLAFPVAAGAQFPGADSGRTAKPFPNEPAPPDPTYQHMEQKRLRQLNLARQKAMISDAEKLLRLAQELNATETAPKPDMGAAERVRKVAEIEKLAHDVKEKMTFASTGFQEVQPSIENRLP